jgi:hypothetical protein
MDIADFAGTSPILLPEEYLAGKLEGWGLIERLTGGLQQRFTVRAHGEWDRAARILSFSETWTFDDGRKDTLNWRILADEQGQYSGEERSLDGRAEGQRSGCAFHWRYSRETPLGDGKSMLLNFNDWFFRIDEKVAMVRGSAGRAGIAFSILHATYRRL